MKTLEEYTSSNVIETYIYSDGNLVSNPSNTSSVIYASFYLFITGTSPTILLFAIYIGIRSKKKHKKQLVKMRIQDLSLNQSDFPKNKSQ